MYIFSLVRGGGVRVPVNELFFSLVIFYSSLCNIIFIVSLSIF